MGLLDTFSSTLQQRLSEGKLEIYAADFGDIVAPLFVEAVFTQTLALTDVSLAQTTDLVTIGGNTHIYNLDNQSILMQVVETNDQRLDFTLNVSPLADDWKPSTSFPQTQGALFDGLALSEKAMIASSYAQQNVAPIGTLVPGLNLYWLVSLNEGSLAVLRNIYPTENSITLRGTVLQNGSYYRLQTTGVMASSLAIAPISLEAGSLANPELTLSSAVTTEDQPLNTAFISGTYTLSETFSYPANLALPNESNTNWYLTNNTTNAVQLATMEDAIQLAGGDALSGIFPPSLTSLVRLNVGGNYTQFDPSTQQWAQFFASITFTPNEDGTPRYWQVLASPNIAVGNFQFGLSTTFVPSEADPAPFILQTFLSGEITIGSVTNLKVLVQIPLEGNWVLQVSADNVQLPTLSDLANFIWPQGGHSEQDILAPLPEGLVDSSLSIAINEIAVAFNPFTPALSSVSFDLSQIGSWTILADFEVYGWDIDLLVDVAANYTITGLLHGFMKIGSVADMEISMPIPAEENGWTISLKPGSTIEFPGIGELLTLISGAPDGLPASFNTFGNFSLRLLRIQFMPQPASIKNFQFELQGKEDWIVLPDFLSFSSVYAALNISQEAEAYTSTGTFNTFVNIFNNAIWIQAHREDLQKNWQFTLAVREEIHLPGLTDLANWMLPSVVVQYIPETFMPFGKGFDLTALNIIFNISTEVLEKIDFTIVNSAPWHAIGDLLVFDHAHIESSVQVLPDDPNESTLEMQIGVTLQVSDAPIAFAAAYTSNTPHWVFTVRLLSEKTFTFNALLEAIHLNELLVIPDSTGLPTLTIKTLEGSMTPETGNFEATGSIIVLPSAPPTADQPADWSIPFLGLQLKMFGLAAEVALKSLEPEDPANKNFYKANLGALLAMNSLQVTLNLQLGSAEIDTIFTGTLSVNEIAALQVDTFSDGLVANQPDSDQTSWSVLTPNDMQAVNYAQAFVYFNQTQNQFFLYGSIANFGDAILLAQKTVDSDERGYLFAFALAENFKFSHLFSALAPIDNILLIKNAGIAITTYTVASATDLVEQVNEILTINDKPGSVQNPIKQAHLPAGAVNKGVHLYAQLLFTGPLFAVFTQLDVDDTSGLDVTLYAFISTETEPNEGSAKTIFQAVIAPFSIISGIVQFSGASEATGVLLEYTQATSTEFKLNGTITFQVFGGTYAFIGNLLVNNDKTHFTLTTTPDTSIIIQLFPETLPPIFVLRELGLDVQYYFQTETRSAKQLEMQVSGQIELVATIFLQANLYLLNGYPVLALVSLSQDFAISSLIGNLVGNGQAWPTDFFDIVFKANSEQSPSRVYYYDAEVDPGHFAGNNLINGYNLEAAVDLTFLYTISLQLRINVQQDVGMEASVGLDSPIPIFILELASKQKASEGNKQYINGPLLTLNTKTETPVFGFATGFNFFAYPFGTADITIGSKSLSNGRTETKIGAKLTADTAVPIFGNLSVDFTYCQSEGFVVNDWPSFTQLYESVQQIIDIADEVSKLMRATDPTFICGAIVDLVADVAYTNQFTMTPSFDTVENTDGQYALYFVLNGQFSVLVADTPVSTIDFPDTVRILLPDNTSFDDLGNYIAQALKDSASSFVKSLMNNSEQWAQLAAVLFVEQAAELAAQWLCEGLIDALTAEAITAGAAALVAEGGVPALVAGGVLAVAAIAACALAVALVFSSCFTSGTEIILADGSVKPIESVNIGDQLLGYGGQFNSVLAYERPRLGKRKLYAFNDGPFFVTAEHPFLTETGWKAIDPEATKRENPNLPVTKLEPGDRLIGADGQSLALNTIQSIEADYNTPLFNFKLSGNNSYYANGYLVHNKGGEGDTGGEGGENPTPEKPSFASPPLTLSDTILTAHWDGARYAAGYELAFYDPNEQQIGDIQSFSLSTFEGSITIPLQFNGGSYRVDLRSTRDSKKSDWVSASIPKLADPYDVLLSYIPNDDKLSISWVQDGATDFEITVFNTADGHKSWYGIGKASPLIITTEYWIAGPYMAKVSAVKQEDISVVPSQPIQSENTLQKLSAVSDFALTAHQQSLQANWQDSQTGVDHYLLAIEQGSNKQQYTIPNNSRSFTIDTDDLAAGTISSILRAIGNGTASMNGPAVSSNNVTKLAAPETVSAELNKTAGYIRCNWSTVQEAKSYTLHLVDENETLVFAANNITPDTLQYDIPLDSLQGNGTLLSLQVNACGDTQILDSNPAISASTFSWVAIPPTPLLSIADGKLVANWSQVTANQGYEATLYNQEDQVETVPLTVDQNSWEILSTQFDGYEGSFSVRVLTLADAQGINSAQSPNSNAVERQATPQDVQLNWILSASALEDGPDGPTYTTEEELRVSWAQTEPTMQLLVEVGEANTPNILARRWVDGKTNSCSWPGEGFPSPPNGNYQASVTALSDENKLDSLPGKSEVVPIINLPPPLLKPLQINNGEELLAELSQPSKEATGYKAQLLADGSPIGEIVVMQADEGDPPLYHTQFTVPDDAGSTFNVQAQATKEDCSPSAWQQAPNEVSRLETTEPPALHFTSDNILTATLNQEIANATAYWSQLVIDGTPVGDVSQMAKEDNGTVYTSSYTLDSSVTGKDVQVRVRCTASQFINSLWTLSDVMLVNPTEIPQAPLLFIEADMLCIVPLEQWLIATHYEVRLVYSDNGVPLDPQPPIQYNQQGARVMLTDLEVDTAYKAQVRALNPKPLQLLINGDASEGFKGWGTSTIGEGQGWTIENGPAISCPGTIGQTNFATSSEWNEKFQTIDLLAAGFSAAQLDEEPLITVEDWISSEGASPSVYYMHIELRDSNNQPIEIFNSGWIGPPVKLDSGYPWEKVMHQFTNYGKGLRRILFEHISLDSQGNPGTKMTGTAVYLTPLYTGVPETWSPLSEPLYTPKAEEIFTLSIYAGNNQAVPRTDLTSIPGGYAYFEPLVIAVHDYNGKSAPNVEVNFSTGKSLSSMIIQIGGHKFVTTKTDSNGLATLTDEDGYSAKCYNSEGNFTIVASHFSGKQTFSLTVLPTPPLPSLSNAKLTIISGNNQSVAFDNESKGSSIAKFDPMVVQVTDEHDQPITNAYVSLSPLKNTPGMHIRVDPTWAYPTLVQTDQDGIACFKKIEGHSVYAYDKPGTFSVSVSVNEGPTVIFNCEATA